MLKSRSTTGVAPSQASMRTIKPAITIKIQPFFLKDRLLKTRKEMNKRVAIKLSMPPRDIVKKSAADMMIAKKIKRGHRSSFPLWEELLLSDAGCTWAFSEGTRKKPNDKGMIMSRYAEK